MIPRRVSTIITWLTEAAMLQQRGQRLFLQQLPQGINFLDYQQDEEPLLPRVYELSTYETISRRVRQEVRNIEVLISQAARERADDSHQMLTELVAGKILAAGGIPRRNKFIDLSTEILGESYVFEMKSTTDTNFHSQVRRTISQLYEYRYRRFSLQSS